MPDVVDRPKNPTALYALLVTFGILSAVFAAGGENALAWTGWTAVRVRSELCPPLAGGVLPVQYRNNLRGTESLGIFLAWLLLLAAACTANRFPDASRRAVQLSLTLSAVALTLYGGSWLDNVLLGQPYRELVSCKPDAAELQVSADQGNHFRALFAFIAGSLMLIGLRLLRGEAEPLPRRALTRVSRWRWCLVILTVLLAVLLVLPIPLGFPEMPEDVAFVVKGLSSLPILLLGLLSLAALTPYRHLRPAAFDAIGTAAGLTISSLAGLSILRHAHQQWVGPDASGGYTVRSDLTAEALNNLDAAEAYYQYVLFAVLVVWVAGWVVGKLVVDVAAANDACDGGGEGVQAAVDGARQRVRAKDTLRHP